MPDYAAFDAAMEFYHSNLGSVWRNVLTTDQLEALPDPVPLVHGVLTRNSLAWLVGEPGAAKSFVALDMACSVATGQPWAGHKVEQGPVLYIAAEGASGIKKRVWAWQGANARAVRGVSWLPMAPQIGTENWDDLAELTSTLEPSLIVVDTQARVAGGLDENSVSEMGELIRAMDRLRSCGACVLIVHHSSKGGAAVRGSTALAGAADTIILCQKDINGLRSVECRKQKDLVEFETKAFRLAPWGESVTLVEVDAERLAWK